MLQCRALISSIFIYYLGGQTQVTTDGLISSTGMAKQPNGCQFIVRLVKLNWLACFLCRGLGSVVLRLPYKDLSTDFVTADHSRWLCKAGVRYGSRDHCLELRLTQASNPVETKKQTARYSLPQSEKFVIFLLPFPRTLNPLQSNFHCEYVDVGGKHL